VKGIYALIIRLDSDVVLEVGALGKTAFNKGTYVYVGSAQANLEQRVKRHLRKEKSLFWHIDYLLNSDAASTEKVLRMEADKTVECALAGEIARRGEGVNGFGCSDCCCRSHLFRVEDFAFLLVRMEILKVEA
jgi:Uri superfamily endonuclease